MTEFSYQLNYDDNSYTITGYKGNEEEINIPDTFLGKPVTIIFDSVFAGHDELERVIIPDSVTDLGEFVFDGCIALKKVRLSSNLVNLWGYTFARCGIDEISLPDKIRIIPPYAFKDCRNLKKVICGSGLKKISPWAFGGCNSSLKLVCSKDVVISEKAFEYNSNILKIEY